MTWERDHLRIGRRFVQMYSLKTTPEASRPCLFADLLKLDCDSILCSTWRPKSSATARREIDQQEKFISFFKVGVLSRVMAGKDTASLDTGVGAKAANNAVDDLSDVIRALDKKAHGEFSLRLLVAARSATELHSISPTVHRVFVDARAQIMEETLGNLSAFYAMFPGNARFNVLPMWMAEDHHAGDKSAKEKLTQLPVFVPAADLDKAKQDAAVAQAAQAATLKAEQTKEESIPAHFTSTTCGMRRRARSLAFSRFGTTTSSPICVGSFRDACPV